MIKIILIALIPLLLGSSANNKNIPNFNCKIDSSWNRFDYDSLKVGVDSSKWILYRIDSLYHYYRSFSYQCKVKGKNFDWYCLVAHMEQEEGISKCLIDSAKISDTIPYPMNIWSYNDTATVEWTEYWVGFRKIREGQRKYTKRNPD